MKYVAILSTTIIPKDGVYSVRTMAGVPASLAGVPSFVGHPATKAVLESLGAVPAPSKLFSGMEVGQIAICCPIKQGQSDRTAGGTAVNQEITIEKLEFREIERIS